MAFEIAGILHTEIQELVGSKQASKIAAVCTRYYDGSLKVEFDPAIPDQPVAAGPADQALKTCASAARRLEAAAPDQEEETQQMRTVLASWASEWERKLNPHDNLRSEEGVNLLEGLRKESEGPTKPLTAGILETLQEAIDPLLQAAQNSSPADRAAELTKERLPVFIYFENYGILDSAIYLPRFLEDLQRAPDASGIRTINAMFKHVRLTAQKIAELGREEAQQAHAQHQERKEARAIKLNSASLDITARFNDWYGQRRHTIDYQADGYYFRIWVADDRRPGELYAAHTTAILMLDDALGQAGTETEIEDILGEEILLPGISAVIGKTVKLAAADRAAGSLPSQIKNWASRRNVDLPDGWKAYAAIHLVSQWAEQATQLPDEVLDCASSLFTAINERFRQIE